MKKLKEIAGKNWVIIWLIMGIFAAMVVIGTSLLTRKTGLVGWWKLDDGTGEVTADSSIYRNHGVLKNGPWWVAGRIGGALDLDLHAGRIVQDEPRQGRLGRQAVYVRAETHALHLTGYPQGNSLERF